MKCERCGDKVTHSLTPEMSKLCYDCAVYLTIADGW